MAEENQNIVQSNGTDTQISPIRFLANSLQARKESIKNSVNNASTQQGQAELETMYEKSMTANNKDLGNEYDRECRKGEFAYYLKEKGKEAGYNTEGIANDALIDNYIQNTDNPQLTFNIMKDYITHPEEDDITPYLVKLGWVEPTEEDEANSWFEKAWDNFTWSFGKAGQGFRTIWNDSNMYDRSGEIGALQDYVYEKYGPNATDEEWDEATRDFRIDNSIIDKYEDLETGIKDLIMGLPISLWNVTGLGALINLGTSVIAATGPGEKAFGYLGEKAETIGYYANKFPGLKQYRDELATEEDKRERDQFVGQEIIALITRGTIKGYKGIKKMSNDGTWGKGLFQRFQENKQMSDKQITKSKEEIRDIADKVGRGKTSDINNTIDALNEVDTTNVKTFSDLDKAFDTAKEKIARDVDKVLEKSEGRITREDLTKTRTKEGEYGPVEYINRSIADAFDDLRKLYEVTNDRVALAELEQQEKIFNEKGFSRKEANDFARKYGNEFKSKAFNKDGSRKVNGVGEGYENTREQIKELVKDGLPDDTVSKLDKKYSQLKNTQKLIKNTVEEINKFNRDLKKKGFVGKVGGAIGKLAEFGFQVATFGFGKEIVLKLAKDLKLVGPEVERLNIAEVEKNLPKMLDKFKKLNERLSKAEGEEVAKVVEDFKKEIGPLEGEIIEPNRPELGKYDNKFLEDKVEVVDNTNPK